MSTLGTHAWRAASVLLLVALFATPNMLAVHAQDRTTIRARLLGDIENLDPAFSATIHDQYIMSNVYSALVRLEPDSGRIIPDLAQSWTVSRDGLTYTFNLRRGVKWHKNFGELTAEDVKFTIDRVLDPATKATNKLFIQAIKTVTIVDPYILRLTLSEPYAPLLLGLAYRAGKVVKKEALQQMGDQHRFSPVGTGPYVFERWDRGREVTLVANEQYYDGAPRIKRVVFRVITDEAVSRLALERGELDMATIRDPESYQILKKNQDIVIVERPATGVRFLMMNTRRKPFDDVRVRRALAYAINREVIANVMLGGTHFPLEMPIGPLHLGYSDKIEAPSFNPPEARRRLAEAGYPNGFSTTLLVTELSPWPLVAPVIRDNLEAVGVKVRMILIEHGAYTATRRRGDYDLIVLGITDPPDPDFIFSRIFHSEEFPPGANVSYYGGADKLIEEARRTTDLHKRAELVQQISRKIIEDAPGIAIFGNKVQVAVRKNIKGHQPGINNDFWLFSTRIE